MVHYIIWEYYSLNSKTLIGQTPLKRRSFLFLQTVFNILLIYFADGLVNFDDIMLKR